MSTHRKVTRVAGLLVVASFVFAACSSSAARRPRQHVGRPRRLHRRPASPAHRRGVGGAADMDALVAAAKAEGGLNTIALPRDWCNYGQLIDGFTAKYGIPINGLNPGGGSKDELEAIKANKTNPGPQAPDVVDVGLSFGPQGVTEDLYQPYKVATWDTIPDDGQGRGRHVVRRLLRRPVVRGQHQGRHQRPEGLGRPAQARVQEHGRPRRRSDRVEPGHLGRLGRRPSPMAARSTTPSRASTSSRSSTTRGTSSRSSPMPRPSPRARPRSASRGPTTPWPTRTRSRAIPPVEVVVPTTGRFGGMYVQAISKYAPHPNAAKLWMEYLYSDEGQNAWLKGYCVPIRYEDMVAKGTVDAGRRGQAPGHRRAPSCRPSTRSPRRPTLIVKGWPTAVGVTVQ